MKKNPFFMGCVYAGPEQMEGRFIPYERKNVQMGLPTDIGERPAEPAPDGDYPDNHKESAPRPPFSGIYAAPIPPQNEPAMQLVYAGPDYFASRGGQVPAGAIVPVCPACGTPFCERDKFCRNCGKKRERPEGQSV